MSPTSAAIRRRAARIKLLLMDVDGVMTDAHLWYVPGRRGEMVETKAFDTQDGIGLQWAHWQGLQTGVISGRDSPALVERARLCEIKYVYQGYLEKLPIYERILADAGLTDHEVAYMGDDLTDAPILARAGLAAAPSNARPAIKRMVHFVTAARGGRGAIRELIEIILRAQGKWEPVLRKYGVAGKRK